jgi:chitodextrinase
MAATAVAAASACAVLVVHPWAHPPVLKPTGLSVAFDGANGSGTTDNVKIVWAGPVAGPLPDEYEVLRNGNRVATVPGRRTSFTDESLVPNRSYGYQVVAARGGKQSPASATLTAETAPLQPTSLAVRGQTISSLEIAWANPQPLFPPETYEILRNGTQVGTVPGYTTTYSDRDLAPDTAYTYQVIAVTGSVQSEASVTLSSARTARPPLTAAVLTGTATVTEKMTSISPADSSWNDQPGASWTDTWTFSSNCAAGHCDTATLDALLAVDTSGSGSDFKMKLTRSGTTYSGTAQIKDAAYCLNSSEEITGTLTTKIKVTAAATQGTTWTATSFSGESTLYTPAEYTCGAETVTANVRNG